MSKLSSNVSVAKNYSIFYWMNAVLLSVIAGILTGGIGLVLLVIAIWYKRAVINRTKILFENTTNRLTFQRGRWFVKDDDVIPVKAVDNVKLNRSISGKLFGWCEIMVETRSENYAIKYVATKDAEKFREAFLELA